MATADSKKQRQLLQQAEKILLHPIHPHLISYCPTMDLIAVVTDEENLDVYRINGQRAFGLKRKNDDVNVDALQWEFNGKSIAVSWSDGSTDLVNAETGKVSHKDLMLPSTAKIGDSLHGEENPARVECIGWGLNFIDVEAVKRRTGAKSKKSDGESTTDAFGVSTTDDWDDFKDDTSIEDFLQRQPDFQTLGMAPDLPDQLAMMDMEILLPKLPSIPLPPALPFMRAVQADSGVFSTQADVDSLLHSHHLKDHNSVDMFIRCSDRGTIHPSIYDSMETVSINLPNVWNLSSTPLLHTSHPYSCSHSLLLRTAAPNSRTSRIAFVPLTLNFIPSAGIYLHLIASKTSQLQNLLLYMAQTLQRIHTYFKHAQDLPGKFMMNITETLEEKGQGDLVVNLFHLACTGHCPPPMREWLVDDLAEQGHKRWDSTVSSSFTTILALVHENLIPAIDRCSIIISRLRGLADFHDRDWIFSGPVSDFSDLLEVLKNMRLLAHTALLYASEEKRQFHAFSKWLRFVIDFEATEPESQSRQEMENKDAGADIAQVLDYIRFGLTKSDLKPFFRPVAQFGAEMRGKGKSSYEDTKKAIEVLREGGGFREEAVSMDFVLGHFKEGLHGLLRQVSRWQEINIRMDAGVVLEEVAGDGDLVADMRMVFVPSSSPTNRDSISTYIALTTTNTHRSSPSNILHIHNITHNLTTNTLPRDINTYALCTLSFPPDCKILDAKFADDNDLLVLLQLPPSTQDTGGRHTPANSLLSIPYTEVSSSTHNPAVVYSPLPTAAIPPTLLPTGSPPPKTLRSTIEISAEMLETYTRHVFEGRFTPLKLVVNGRKGRRVVVVLGSDRKHYRVLDMDFRKGGGRAGHNESDNDELDGEGDTEMIEA